MSFTIHHGDCLEVLRDLKSASVHCCVTSPPYFGLRDYGDPGQIGLEPNPEAYVDKLVEVFREVRRVLRDDGTLWLNLGDTYASDGGPGWQGKNGTRSDRRFTGTRNTVGMREQARTAFKGMKAKDLIGIPWRVALALQADGWCLRQEIIWHKPNPLPESVKDRCTKSHEQIFMFCKASWSGSRPPRQMKESDARWLALLIEAEGNIAVRRYTHNRETPQHALQIAVANTDKALLVAAQNLAGRGAILEAKGTNRPIYYLQWTTKEAASLLWDIYPYLFGKKRQAAIGLMLEDRRSNRNKGNCDDIYFKDGRHYRLQAAELEFRDKMWRAVKSLNQHQDIDLSWLVYPKEGSWTTNPYYFDAKAIAEPSTYGAPNSPESIKSPYGQGFTRRGRAAGNKTDKYVETYDSSETEEHRTKAGLMKIADKVWDTRNKRSVWTVSTKPFRDAHFATFPPDLIEPCIKAGISIGGTVLDPFGGAGTTGLVAERLGRNSVLVEMNREYVEMATRRIIADAPLLTEGVQ